MDHVGSIDLSEWKNLRKLEIFGKVSPLQFRLPDGCLFKFDAYGPSTSIKPNGYSPLFLNFKELAYYLEQCYSNESVTLEWVFDVLSFEIAPTPLIESLFLNIEFTQSIFDQIFPKQIQFGGKIYKRLYAFYVKFRRFRLGYQSLDSKIRIDL